MIKLYDGQITDLLPEKIAKDTDTRCLSFAIQQEHRRLLDLTDRTRTLSVIDELPEKILDVLAVELRTPYYQESMNLETKRDIIKRTLLWHTKAGTPSAVAELIEIVFGEGSIVEWFNYEEPPFTPGTFDIVTNAQMTEEITAYFLSIIRRVKNTRSHIRRILINRRMDAHWYVGTGARAEPHGRSFNDTQVEQEVQEDRYGAAGFVFSPKSVIQNNLQFDDIRTDGINTVAAAITGHTVITIENNAAPRAAMADGGNFGAVASHNRTTTVITNDGHKTQSTVAGTVRAAAAGHSSPKQVITNQAEETVTTRTGETVAIGVASHSKSII